MNVSELTTQGVPSIARTLAAIGEPHALKSKQPTAAATAKTKA